jgi:hypothetical protein
MVVVRITEDAEGMENMEGVGQHWHKRRSASGFATAIVDNPLISVDKYLPFPFHILYNSSNGETPHNI